MVKEDFVWIGIRVFGIYLLVMAVVTLPAFAGSIFMSVQWMGFPTVDEASTDADMTMNDMLRGLRETQLSALIANGVRLVVFTIFGLYFVHGGQLVFRLASKPLE